MKTFRLGPLTLLLTVIAICLAVLSILALSTARADLAMAEKTAATVREDYQLEIQGQEFLTSGLTHGLTSGEQQSDGTLRKVFTSGNKSLIIELRPSGETYEILRWQFETSWSPNEEMNLWSGE